MNRPDYDLLIKGVRVVRPHGNAVHEAAGSVLALTRALPWWRYRAPKAQR